MNHVFIEVRGGVVQAVRAQAPLEGIEIHIVDWDDLSDGVTPSEDIVDYLNEINAEGCQELNEDVVPIVLY